MSVELGVVMDPIGSISYKKDSTLAMLWEAQDRDFDLWYMEPRGLSFRSPSAHGTMRPLKVSRDPNNWYEFLGEPTSRPLDELQVILMRKDPPFDLEYIYATYALDRAEAEGVLVVNAPQALRDANEKYCTAWFPEASPPTLFTKNQKEIHAFLEEEGRCVGKPLDGMGGKSIFVLDRSDSNLNVILETLTDQGRTTVTVQKYLPEIKDGDKRVLLIDGKPIPKALARLAPSGDHRGNLAVGAKGKVVDLTERDRWLCAQVGPTLAAKGILFAGLDIIGDWITEINVTSPTCIRELEEADPDLRISGQMFDCILSKIR